MGRNLYTCYFSANVEKNNNLEGGSISFFFKPQFFAGPVLEGTVQVEGPTAHYTFSDGASDYVTRIKDYVSFLSC